MLCAICAVDLANEESCAIDAVKLGRRKKILAICAAEFVSGNVICAICAVNLLASGSLICVIYGA